MGTSTFPAIAPSTSLVLGWPCSYFGKTPCRQSWWSNSQNKNNSFLHLWNTAEEHVWYSYLDATTFSHSLVFSLWLMVSKKDPWNPLSRLFSRNAAFPSKLCFRQCSSIVTVYIMLLSGEISSCTCPDLRGTCKKRCQARGMPSFCIPFLDQKGEGEDIPECRSLDYVSVAPNSLSLHRY